MARELTFSLLISGRLGVLASLGQDIHLISRTCFILTDSVSIFQKMIFIYLKIFRKKAKHTDLRVLQEHAEEVGDHLFLELVQHSYTVKARSCKLGFSHSFERGEMGVGAG